MPVCRRFSWLSWLACCLGLLLLRQGVETRPAAPPVLVPQNGHGSVIADIAFSPDGRLLATASEDKTAILWDVATGASRLVLRGHTSWVQCVAFSPDGRTLATGSEDDTVILWNAASGATLGVLKGHAADVSGVCFSPDGRLLASRSEDGQVRLWDAATGEARGAIAGASGRVAFSPDGRLLAMGTRRNSILFWNVAAGKEDRSFRGRIAPIASLAFSPDGRTLACGDDNGAVTLWDMATGKPARSLAGHEDVVSAICFSRNGRLLATGSSDVGILWDVTTGKARQSLDADARAVAFSPDGRLFAATDGTTVGLREVDSGKVRRVLRGQAQEVLQVAVSPDGRTLAEATPAGTVLWDLADAEARATLRGHTAGVTCVAFAPDGRSLATGSEDRTIAIWDTATRQARRALQAGAEAVESVAFSPDGHLLAAGSADGTVSLWSAETGEKRSTLRAHAWPVAQVAFSPDGRTLASASCDTSIGLWDVEKGELRARLVGHRGWVFGVAFSPDGRLLTSAAKDKSVRLWDVAKGVALETLTGHAAGARSVAFSPDGSMLASGDEGGALILWDVASRQARITVHGHTGLVGSVAFRPDGRTLATGSWDGSLRLWDAATGAEVASAFSLDEGLDWLIATPKGYYNASLNGGRLVRWRVGGALYPVAQYARRFKKPDLVAQALQGEGIPAVLAILTAETRPPTVTLEAAGGRAEVEGSPVRVRIEAAPGTPGGRIKRVELRVNGRPADLRRATDVAIQAAGTAQGDAAVDAFGTARSVRARPREVPGNQVVVEAAVALLPDEDEIRLVASAYDDGELRGDSELAVVRVKRATVQAAVNCYVLAIGVSKYATAEYNLSFADADARELAGQFRGQQGALFRKVETRLITDADATTGRIQAGLKWLRERPGPGDTAVVLFSGHGVRGQLRKLYFYTHNGDLDALRKTCLSWESVEEALLKCRARQVLVFMDCCHAGAFGERRASVDELAESLVDNVVVFASSRGNEESVEHPDWGHGAFTRAVLDGLRGGADFDKAGIVTAGGLVRYLPERVGELTGDRQHPIVPRPEELDAGLRLARLQAGGPTAAQGGPGIGPRRAFCQPAAMAAPVTVMCRSDQPAASASLTDRPGRAILPRGVR